MAIKGSIIGGPDGHVGKQKGTSPARDEREWVDAWIERSEHQ